MTNKVNYTNNGKIDCVSISLAVVRKNNDVFRFDAEYFNREALLLDDLIRSRAFYVLKDKFDVSKLAGFEFTKFFTKENMEDENSYVALTSKNIQRENLLLNETIRISKKAADDNLSRSKLYLNDIVLSYTGEYRRSLVMDKPNFQLGPNVCRIRSKESMGSPFFLSLFLNCYSGQIILDREKTLSAQPTVAMSRIREIPVPLFSKEYLDLIEKCYSNMNQMRNKSKELMQRAESLLNFTLGFDQLILKKEVCSIKRLAESVTKFQRFDAEYYQEKYEQIQSQIKKGFQTIKIGDAVEICDKNFSPNPEQQYKYLELADIDDDFHIVDFSFEYGNKLPSRARRLVHTGDVLVSTIQGSMETIAIANDSFDSAICSNGFFVCKCKKIRPEIFALLLKNKYINMLLQQRCTGTILMSIDKENFEAIELPYLNEKTTHILINLYGESSSYFIRSEKILNELLDIVNNSLYVDEKQSIKRLISLESEIGE